MTEKQPEKKQPTYLASWSVGQTFGTLEGDNLRELKKAIRERLTANKTGKTDRSYACITFSGEMNLYKPPVWEFYAR